MSQLEISRDFKKKMFFDLLRIRRIEEEISRKYSEQEMRCPVHLSIGQESISVGISANLKSTDYIMSGHRSHAQYLACGGNLNKFIAELYGKETGCTSGIGGSMHLIDKSVGFLGSVPVIASTISMATGIAFENSRRKNKNVTVVYFGDSATEEGVFYESINFAKKLNLPILYVCENNRVSVETPIQERRNPEQKIVDIVRSFNIDSVACSGQNCEEVFKTSKFLIDDIRKGKGPKFIEFETHRMVEHCGPKIKKEGKLASLDPLEIYQVKLLKEGVLDQEQVKEYQSIIDKEIKEAFLKAKEAKFPSVEKLKENIFYTG